MFDPRYKAKDRNEKKFGYDYVFGPKVDQEAFYASVGMPKLVGNVLKGFNATVFAYGPTGSGKTYTMQGQQEIKNVAKYVTIWYLVGVLWVL